MSRFILLTLALAASIANAELVVEVPRELGSYDDDYSSGKGGSGKGGMMGGSGKGKGGSGKGYDPEPVPAPTHPPVEPCVCVEICEEPDEGSGKGKGGMMGRELMMGKGGKGYSDDDEPVCHEECTGGCFPEPPPLECCETELVCPDSGSGKGGMMMGGTGKGGKGSRELMMGKGGKGSSDDEDCEEVCVKYCPPKPPVYTLTPGDGDMCYDTGAYTTGDDCVCNCECCMDEPEDDDSSGKGGMMMGGSGKGGMMGGSGKGKGYRELMMGKGGMMGGSGKGYDFDPTFSCDCGCACPETVPAPSPSPGKGGMMMGKGGMMSGKGSSGGKGSDDDYRL